MLDSQEQAAQQLLQEIYDRQASYSSVETRKPAFESVLNERLAQLHNTNSSSQIHEDLLLPPLEQILKQPKLVKLDLLVAYMSEIVRFVENIGLGLKFVQEYLDKAIEVYEVEGYSLIDLYLTKAKYLRLDKLENPEREKALKTARKYAEEQQDKKELIKVLIALAEYYTEVSQYQESIQACHECENLIKENLKLSSIYYPIVLTNYAMNYFPLLKYDIAQEYLLQARRQLEITTSGKDDRPQERTIATVLHYLGRITEARGNLQDAMSFYIDGEKYQQMCPEELSASAFYHLRLGELLISANRQAEAKDHIRKSEELFLQIQFSSSGTIQTALAWASICDKEGKYGEAKRYTDKAIKEARARNFVRGELYCLVKLFWLELKHRKILSALYVFLQAMKTWRKGEIARNGGLNLVGQYLLQVLLTPIKLLLRSPHKVLGTAAFNSSISHCTCPKHQPNNVAEVLMVQKGIQEPSSVYSHIMSDKP